MDWIKNEILAHRIYKKWSKVSAVSYIWFAKNLSNVLLSKQWCRESSSISRLVSSTPKYYQRPRHGPLWWPGSSLFCFDDLVPCVAGWKVWTLREKAIKLISEAKKVVSVLDEAFTTLAALMNYWERWTGNGMARWTDSKAGNYQYMGSADAAYVQFDELCKQICEQRQTRLNKRIEQMYLARSCSLLAGEGQHSQPLGELVEINVEVYNKLESEEED